MKNAISKRLNYQCRKEEKNPNIWTWCQRRIREGHHIWWMTFSTIKVNQARYYREY